MYSSFHERHGDVWAELADFADADSALRIDYDQAERCLTFRSEARLRELGIQLDADEFAWTEIGLWRYQFDPSTLRFSRHLLVEVTTQ